MSQELLDELPASTRPNPGRMTYEEFLDWVDEETYAEWVEGEVQFMSPVSNLHQDRADFLAALLRHYVEAYDLGQVRTAPFQMKVGPELSGREPDILFVAKEHRDRLQKVYLNGPADLAVEIISPESRRRDREEKYREYEQGGVREYWIIDPDREEADFFVLSEAGSYQPIPLDERGRYQSAVLPGLWLEVDWLWQEPLPRLMDILKAWKLV